jgi:hypothetical protein
MTQTLARVLLSLTVFALAFSAGLASAALPEALQRKGDEMRLFYDFSGKVPATKAEEIDRKLLEASQASGIATVLVVVQRMGAYEGMPTKAPDFAYTLAKEWRVGNPKNGKGILLLFALEDRKFHAVKSKNLPVSLTDQIAGSLKGEVTYALSQGDVAGAMEKAAQKIAERLNAAAPSPVAGSGNSAVNNQPRGNSTPVGFVPAEGRPQPFERQTRSSGGWGWVILVVGGIILVIVIISVVGAFSSARTYGGGYGGYGGYGYPGYGYGGGDGGFFSGMMMGGLMGNMFGGGGRTVEHHYHDVGGSSASSGSSGFDLGSSGSSFGSWGGGDSSGGSWGGSSFTGSDGGGFSGFGGGDFGGGSSGGEW